MSGIGIDIANGRWLLWLCKSEGARERGVVLDLDLDSTWRNQADGYA